MHLRLYFIVIGLVVVNSAKSEPLCNGQESAQNYWAPKVGLLSNRVDQILIGLDDGERLTREEQAILRRWMVAVYSTAEEVNETLGLSPGEVTEKLIDPMRSELFTKGSWSYKKDTFPGISFSGGANKKLRLTGKSAEPQSPSDPLPLVAPDTTSLSSIRRCEAAMECSQSPGNICEVYLLGWANSVSAYHFKDSKEAAERLAKLAIKYEESWDDFFKEARSQTWADRSLTAFAYRNKLRSNRFVFPPDYQYFAFHPSLVVDYTGEAQEGSRSDVGLAIEWLGVNKWSGCKWLFDVPCGASIASLYSDKKDVDSVRHGLMLHLDNAYSFGVVGLRGGDTGVFFSVDLLKTIETKHQQVENWGGEAHEIFAKEF